MSDLLRLALEAETRPTPLRADDTPEVQAERRRVLLEAMAPDQTQCQVCGKTVNVRRPNKVGDHYWGLRRCAGSGELAKFRLVPAVSERLPVVPDVKES